MISRIEEIIKVEARILYKEAQELGMIFSTIITKTKNK
ncbi:MAG: four helix bundle protein, partial [Candidatus Roizmanbacteria bacterium]|nr:four helix bundle protein [Candidatus Roizmanbacteria bacterium]